MRTIRLALVLCLALFLHSNILGQRTPPAGYYYWPLINIDGVPLAERVMVRARMIEIIKLLNNPPGGPLNGDERALLQYAPLIAIHDEPIKNGYYDAKTNTIKLYKANILHSRTADNASVILHENVHAKLFKEGGWCSTWGKEAEAEGIQVQIDAEAKLGGYDVRYSASLRNDVSNPTHHKRFVPGYEVIAEEDYEITDSTIFYSFHLPELSFLKGDVVEMCSRGEVFFGPFAGSGDPDGLYNSRDDADAFSMYSLDPRYLHGALLYRLNPTNQKLDLWHGWYLMGKTWVKDKRWAIQIPQNARLEFAMNDEEWDNNRGRYIVRIRVFRPTSRQRQYAGELPNTVIVSP